MKDISKIKRIAAMGLLKILTNLIRFPGEAARPSRWLSVKCSRCGEVIRARVDMQTELSAEYGEGEGNVSYICRKVLVGEGRCFQPVEVVLTFDKNRKLVDHQVTSGEFVEFSKP